MSSTAPANPYAPPTANVADTASDSDTLEQAGRGARFGAAMLDGIIMMLLVYVPPMVMAFAAGFDPSALAGGSSSMLALLVGPIGVALLVGLLIWSVITFVLVKRNSQTIGKKLVGIKVVRSDGSHASLGRIFWLRNVVNALPAVIPFVSSIYVLVDHLFIFTESRQCVHDKIADTIVVKA